MKISVRIAPELEKEYARVMGHEMTAEDLLHYTQNAVNSKKNLRGLWGFQREVFNAHDWSVETLSKHLTEDIIDHNAFPGDIPGIEGVRSRFSYWAEAFQEEDDLTAASAAQGDTVAVLYVLEGVNSGPYMGIEATNKVVDIPGIEFVRFEDGKIAEHWGIYDFLSTAEEIGATLSFTPRSYGMPRRPEIPWAGPPVNDDAPRAEPSVDSVN